MLKEKNKRMEKIILILLLALFAAGFAFVAHILEYGAVKIVRYYLLAGALFYLALVDLREKIIPNRVLLGMLGARSVLLIVELCLYTEYAWNFLLSSASGAALAVGILLIGYYIGKKGMGFGDIKLFGVIGFFVGPMAVLGILFFTLCFAALCSIALLALKKIGVKEEIAFAPFAFAGMVAASLLGI